MTENEAIDELNTSIDLAKMCTENLERKREVQGYETAIKALKEIQQYRELEKRLTGMFSGELSLETVVDELERYLKEPGNPHPINAKILTYKEAADWYAYKAIGTPEECRAAMEKQTARIGIREKIKKGYNRGMHHYYCPVCYEKGDLRNKCNVGLYCSDCGQKLDWEDEE